MIEDYRKARRRGLKEVNRAFSAGTEPYVVALEEKMGGLPFARETSLGTMEIPLELIVGTRVRGRANLFSAGFMPIAGEDTEFATKWSRLIDSQVEEGLRDPIKVIECLGRFYVEEGNKRVSVSRYLGAHSILADVTRATPVSSPDMEEALERYEAFQRFFAVCPLYEMEFADASDYELLADLMGRDLETPWPDQDVRRLKSTFYLFRDLYLKSGGAKLDLAPQDAYLRYLETYADTVQGSLSEKDARRRIKAMWDEFVVAEKDDDDAIAFVGEPGQKVATGTVATKILKAKRPKELRVAFIYDRTPDTSGWVRLFEEGRRHLEAHLAARVFTETFEGCSTEIAFMHAVDAAASDGCTMVVCASPRQMVSCKRAAVIHKNLQFLDCSVNLSSGVVRSFYARMYEVKFLMGALAAGLSESHQLGYVAPAPINGAVAEINAFALGAMMVDPKAVVHLLWSTGTSDWKASFDELGVDVVSGVDYPDPLHEDEPYGLYSVRDGRTERLARPIWDWGRYFELMLPTVARESGRTDVALGGRAINYWWGMRSGVVGLGLEEGLAQGQMRLVQVLRDAILNDSLRPFDTALHDQTGTVVRGLSEPELTDEKIASMSWLNINVSGELPRSEDLSEDGKADVAASGLAKSRQKKA